MALSSGGSVKQGNPMIHQNRVENGVTLSHGY